MAKSLPNVLAAALLLALGALNLPAGVLLSENFSGATPGFNIPAGQLPGTIMTAIGAVDVLGAGVFPEVCTNGSLTAPCVDLNALGAGGLRTTSTYALAAGVTYRIQVSFYGNAITAPITVDISFGSPLTTQVTINPNATTNIDMTFTGDGSNAHLMFTPNATGANGGIIDNILVQDVEGEVPEPATWLGLGSGLALFGLLKLKLSRR